MWAVDMAVPAGVGRLLGRSSLAHVVAAATGSLALPRAAALVPRGRRVRRDKLSAALAVAPLVRLEGFGYADVAWPRHAAPPKRLGLKSVVTATTSTMGGACRS